VIEPSRRGSRRIEIALDAVTSVLLAAFVVFLFVGYLGLYPSLPSSTLAALALFGSLAVLCFANWSGDRRNPQPSPSST
jgi:hypothetical protein